MAEKSTRQKLEQGRAAHAYEAALLGYAKHEKEYAQAAKKVPMMIKTNGLGATLAFMFSKQKVLGLLLEHIENWLDKNEVSKSILNQTHGRNLVQRITELDSVEYRVLSIEVLAFLNWLRRFADGIVKEKEKETASKKI